MNKLTILKLTSLLPLAGCATPIKTVDYYDLPTDALVKIRDMRQVPETAILDGNYTDVGIVTGMSCHRNRIEGANAEGSESRKIAFEQLQLNAALLGADHISTPQCVVNEKMDLSNNCWTSLVCESQALKVSQLETSDMGR
jgi:hypothetical protein